MNDITDDLGVLNGFSVTLNCTGSSGVGNVSITWSTSNPVITLPQPTETALDENTTMSTITLDSVSANYGGVYICNVTNRFGEVTGNVSLSVISKLHLPLVRIIMVD